ncbi:hypothetical protein [Pectobacterium versatile]|uniref:hypothetical protein n=1 Tax=Pectobacterium versatile TaxID=2488639 RepID=UPI000CFE53BA|nr:hypothetical protein [Pectobacterium versatile]PRI21497.1 hypothetical protein BZY99_04970 [Pectobacterium versatile]
MMLKNISFDGFIVESSSYKEVKISEKGFFNVALTEMSVSVDEKEDKKEDENSRIMISFESNITGYEGDRREEPDEESIAFTAKLKMETWFIDKNENPLTADEVIHDVWFFENFNYVAVKIACDSLFKYTAMGEIPVPWTGR